jgi:glutamine synthetase
MAAGPLLPQAIEDLSALPADAHERAVAEQILLNLQHALGNKPSRTAEEQEFIVTMQNSWEKAREEGRKEGRKEGRDEGRNEARAEAAARAVLTVLRARGIDVPEAARERILAQKDIECLQRWLEKAAVAASVAEVIGEPS